MACKMQRATTLARLSHSRFDVIYPANASKDAPAFIVETLIKRSFGTTIFRLCRNLERTSSRGRMYRELNISVRWSRRLVDAGWRRGRDIAGLNASYSLRTDAIFGFCNEVNSSRTTTLKQSAITIRWSSFTTAAGGLHSGGGERCSPWTGERNGESRRWLPVSACTRSSGPATWPTDSSPINDVTNVPSKSTASEFAPPATQLTTENRCLLDARANNDRYALIELDWPISSRSRLGPVVHRVTDNSFLSIL